MINIVETVKAVQRNHITNLKYYRDHKNDFATLPYSTAFGIQNVFLTIS